MHRLASDRLPTARQARRSLLVGGIALALAVTLSVVALPLGIRGQGVARIDFAPTVSADHAGAAGIAAQPGSVDLQTAPVASLTRDATATVELVDDAASRARLSLLRGGAWVEEGASITLTREEAVEGVTVRVRAVDPRHAPGWDGVATVRLTVSQGLLPDTDEIDIDLSAS